MVVGCKSISVCSYDQKQEAEHRKKVTVIEDLKRAINELAPPDRYYEHERAWHDGNGHSHVQSALLGPSVSISIRGGKLELGTWQQIVLINHDVHPRLRKVSLTIIGTDEG